ncbi:MAG: heme exporter protein CcmD [Woeseiaceae bacterium]
MREFLAMGGYAAFVWPSFALTAIVMIANWWLAVRAERTTLRVIQRQLANHDLDVGASFREVSS